ncbi:MAG: ATP-binding cassette domain-containing protein [Planctomycetota bacterium]
MIVVEHLRKTFQDLRRGEIVAVDDASFECKSGKIFGLLGLNGAGKTTTMRILSTVLKPTAGRATVAGFDVLREPLKVRQNIGFLSNSTALYDRMSAWEHVEYFGKLYGIGDDVLYPRMEKIFDSLQMQEFRDLPVSKMSTGMRQKVSIARSIVHDPPVLIFDEPTSGLDVLVARAVLRNVLEFRDQGKCIIYSTHIMREVEKLCDEVAVIHHGRILAQGTLPELYDRYGINDVEEIFHQLVESAIAREATSQHP